MAIRNIIKIDEEKCDGCGHCVEACAEGAIQIIDGKAKLVGEILCDGFGACLGSCPQDALTIEKREAEGYDEEAVKKHLAAEKQAQAKPEPEPLPCGCPGSALKTLMPQMSDHNQPIQPATSFLSHWPVQLKLVPPHAPFLKGADLLICADCVPFALPDFHGRYLMGRAVVVGCPKLDDLQYYLEKLKDIFKTARPSRITVLKMEVPCCNGIAQAAMMARQQASSDIPLEVHTIMINGGIRIDTVIESQSARKKPA